MKNFISIWLLRKKKKHWRAYINLRGKPTIFKFQPFRKPQFLTTAITWSLPAWFMKMMLSCRRPIFFLIIKTHYDMYMFEDEVDMFAFTIHAHNSRDSIHRIINFDVMFWFAGRGTPFLLKSFKYAWLQRLQATHFNFDFFVKLTFNILYDDPSWDKSFVLERRMEVVLLHIFIPSRPLPFWLLFTPVNALVSHAY